MTRTFFCFVLMVFLLPVEAQQTVISGNAPDYAGSVLKFYSIDNYISNNEIELGKCTVAANGDFQISFEISNNRLVYLHLGIFKPRFIVQRGFSYEVKLPPRTDKTPEEASSPFFEETTVYLFVLSAKDDKGKTILPEFELNMRMIRFDETYNPIYDQVAMDAMRRKPVKADSIIQILKEGFPVIGNKYFDDYATYRAGLLYYAAQQSGVKNISNVYFAGKPVLYDNEAYMELFNITYDKYFMYFGRTREGEVIYQTINVKESFSQLKQLLGQDGVLPGDSLRELVILKNIYDEFYSDRFSRQSLLRLLDSAMVQTRIERHKEIAGQIRSDITKLLRGFAPPDFSLYNQDSALVSLQDYKGKYVYLMFCTTQNYVCLSQYEQLKELYKAHHKWLQIVVVSIDDQFGSMRDFRKKNGYLWDFLHYANHPDVLKEYDVRIFPTCYLIDPDGKLVLSPAPDASNNIEQILYRELNSKGTWNEYIKKGWIEDRKRVDKRFELDLNIPPK